MFSRLESLAYRWCLEPYVFVRSPSKLYVLEGGGNEDIWQEKQNGGFRRRKSRSRQEYDFFVVVFLIC